MVSRNRLPYLRVLPWAVVLVVTSGVAFAAGPGDSAAMAVDFRYSLPWWQGVISMIDNPDKILVGKEGQLLFDYNRKSRGNRRFLKWIESDTEKRREWISQELVSAKTPVVRTHYKSGDLRFTEQAFAATAESEPYSVNRMLQRGAIILVQVMNTGAGSETVVPKLILRGVGKIDCDKAGGQVIWDNTVITASLPFEKDVNMPGAGETWRREVTLGGFEIPAGGTKTYAICVSRDGTVLFKNEPTANALKALRRAIDYWENLPLPYDVIQIPDEGIQNMLVSCIRNIHQARDIKNGLPAYVVGPTCYRGLWIVDGAFLLEAVTMLGMVEDARSGIEYMWTHQRDDGGFTIIPKYWKESGIVLWAVTRHARLTQDKVWLEKQWPRIEKTFGFIQGLRRSVSDDPNRLNYKLMPGGYIDGGLSYKDGNTPEYSNVYWNLVGVKAAVEAARWLGKNKQANEWQAEYDDFYGAFRKAAKRDMRTDAYGNRYLPTVMANVDNHLPQRGQWCFCHAVYPGRIFSADDPILRGNLAMLEKTEREGLIYGTGWAKEGLWTYFASFYGHALLWNNNGQKAAEVLYAFANHAAPNMVWREEQQPIDDPDRGKEVGDMPHNWASAEFIRLTSHLVALDRGSELHLFEGLPKKWVVPGKAIRLKGLYTPYGKLTLELSFSGDGKNAHLPVMPLDGRECRKVAVHLGYWADSADLKAVREFAPQDEIRLDIRLK